MDAAIGLRQHASASASSLAVVEDEEIANLLLYLEEAEMAMAAKSVREGRNLEEVDYWRKVAGWYDDDLSMIDYNKGVYDSYYKVGDDDAHISSSGSSSSASSSGSGVGGGGAKTFWIILGVLAGIVMIAFLVRAMTRGSSSPSKKKETGSTGRSLSRSRSARKRSESRSNRSASRSRSKSVTRSRSSRSRSRNRNANKDEGTDYELMDDNKSQKSKRSTRSRSRSVKRSRSKSRNRSSREEMLV